MANSSDLGPGSPLLPRTGYSQRPRATDYPVGVNIASSTREAWGRTSYATLKAVIDAYDVARMCINHKIDEMRSMEPLFQPADGVSVTCPRRSTRPAPRSPAPTATTTTPSGSPSSSRVRSATTRRSCTSAATWPATRHRPRGRRRHHRVPVRRRERPTPRTARAGVLPAHQGHHRRVVHDGRHPVPPVPPADRLPVRLAPIESVLLTANTDMRFQWHFLQMFTDGTVPAGLMQLPPDISSPDQVAEWQDYWDAFTSGDQSILHKLIAVPAGTQLIETKPKVFDKTFRST